MTLLAATAIATNAGTTARPWRTPTTRDRPGGPGRRSSANRGHRQPVRTPLPSSPPRPTTAWSQADDVVEIRRHRSSTHGRSRVITSRRTGRPTTYPRRVNATPVHARSEGQKRIMPPTRHGSPTLRPWSQRPTRPPSPTDGAAKGYPHTTGSTRRSMPEIAGSMTRANGRRRPDCLLSRASLAPRFGARYSLDHNDADLRRTHRATHRNA